MTVVPVKQISSKATLAKDVYTPLGGLLFTKGTVIEEKERQFLEAFLIREVEIEESVETGPSDKLNGTKGKRKAAARESGQSAAKQKDLETLYQRTVKSFRKVLKNIESGSPIPLLEIRETITPLLEKGKDHPEITFKPQKTRAKEDYLYEHPVAVGLLSFVLASWLGIPEKERMQVALAGTLLDVGKTRIDQRILWKPDKLTAEEFAEMKRHTIYGYQLLREVPGLNEGVALAALQHHEREDGSGYPLGLPGHKLHRYSKIVAVADVFHAMCSDRIHQQAASPYLVVEQLLRDSFGKFDPKIVYTFVNGIIRLSIGTVVELSDGRIGKIVFTDQNNPTRPLIETNCGMVNLLNEKNLYIKQIL